MILTTLCSPHMYDTHPRTPRLCSLCCIERNFHIECIERAKEANEPIICFACSEFIRFCLDNQYSLFEKIR